MYSETVPLPHLATFGSNLSRIAPALIFLTVFALPAISCDHPVFIQQSLRSCSQTHRH